VQNYDFSAEIQREWGEIRCLVFLANSFIVTCQAAHLYNIFHSSCKDLRNSTQAHHSLLSPLLGPFYTANFAIALTFSALQISSYFHPNLFSDS
jgi:Mn2+/Fe2+ NRAMP family transporter